MTGELGLRPAGWGGDAAVADLNGDGWPDLFILNMQGHGHYFENARGRAFVDRTAASFPKTPWGASKTTLRGASAGSLCSVNEVLRSG